MLNIIRLLDDYNINYDTEGVNTSEDFVNVKCMFCDDHSNHLGIHRSGEYSSCWMCGKHSIEDTLMNLLSLSYLEVKNIIDDYSGVSDIRNILLNKKQNNNNIKLTLPGEELKQIHKDYLIGRGFDPDYIVNRYKIKGTGYTGRWKYRIMIPIFLNNQLVSYQGRDITNKQRLRYDTLSKEESGFDLGIILYDIDNCRNNDIIGVVEGSFDKWSMGSNFVAVLTSNLTDYQILILSKYRKVVFIFDPEKKAYEKAKKAAERLSMIGVNSYVITLDKGIDPAKLKKSDVKYIRREIGLDYERF